MLMKKEIKSLLKLRYRTSKDKKPDHRQKAQSNFVDRFSSDHLPALHKEMARKSLTSYALLSTFLAFMISTQTFVVTARGKQIDMLYN